MKNIITLSFIFSLLLILTPGQSDAQFGNIIKKGKKSAKKVLKQKSSKSKKDKEPKQSKRNKRQQNKDINISGSDNDTENNTWIYPAKLAPSGTIMVSEMNDEQRMRHEAGLFISAVTSALGSIRHGALTLGDRNHLTEAHRPFFIESNYEPRAHEIMLIKILKKEWPERKPNINEYYNNIDRLYQESLAGNHEGAYLYDGELVLESLSRTLRLLNNFVFPEDQELKALHAYAEKRIAQLKPILEDDLNEIAINDVHKANLNKILFTSNKNINPETAPASAYKTDFVPGEEIYAVAMLDKGINDKLVHSYPPELSFRFNGVFYKDKYPIANEIFTVKDNQQYYIFPVVVNASNFKCSKKRNSMIGSALKELSTYGPRKHEVTIELHDWDEFHNKQGDVTGIITIDGSQKDMIVYQDMAYAIMDKCPKDQ